MYGVQLTREGPVRFDFFFWGGGGALACGELANKMSTLNKCSRNRR